MAEGAKNAGFARLTKECRVHEGFAPSLRSICNQGSSIWDLPL